MENFIRCHEAIHVISFAVLPFLDKSIKKWHHNEHHNIATCSMPSVCPTSGKPTLKKRSCPACIKWGQSIENVYFPSSKTTSIQWSNIDITRVYNDPIEAAKAFVLRLVPGKTYAILEDFDVASIMMLAARFGEFHQKTQAVFDKIQKVLIIRNSLSHMKIINKMHLDDSLTKQYFDAIIDMVNSLYPLHFSKDEVDLLLKEITQIRHSPVTTKMTEEALRPFTHAVEQIVQQAIEEYLLELSPHLESGLKASHFDLEMCQRHLQQHYLQDMCKIPQYPGDIDTCLEMDQIYTNLSILYEMPQPCSAIKFPLQSQHDVFTRQVNGICPSRILVVGKGGSGKSTLLAKYAYDWATNASGSPLKNIPLVFALNMRWMQSDTDLEEAILHQLLPPDTKITKDALGGYLEQNQSSFILLLDSYDEFGAADSMLTSTGVGNILRILSNRFLTSCRVIVTSRHWRASEFSQFPRLYVKFEIDGFSKDNVQEYIRKFFHSDREAGERLYQYIAASNLFDVASFPLMTQLLCIFWRDTNSTTKEPIPSKVGELYTAVFRVLYNHCLSKDPRHQKPMDLPDLIVKLGEIACLGLWPPANRLVFTREEVEKLTTAECVRDGCEIGLISMEKVTPTYQVKGITGSAGQMTWTFLKM
ncbi:uncharacterized protein [Amphiura filiformis]|uniref:uncharacterized protein n=1 Tax=Amphiura filiformis TaxID=82378 RepID=UPI003B220D0B